MLVAINLQIILAEQSSSIELSVFMCTEVSVFVGHFALDLKPWQLMRDVCISLRAARKCVSLVGIILSTLFLERSARPILFTWKILGNLPTGLKASYIIGSHLPPAAGSSPDEFSQSCNIKHLSLPLLIATVAATGTFTTPEPSSRESPSPLLQFNLPEP